MSADGPDCIAPKPWCWAQVESAALTRSPATVGNTRADGQSLAYRRGRVLMDMEFVQFHPTGMICPPSVQGILVTEGVRGEGGVLRITRAAIHVRRYSGELEKSDRR